MESGVARERAELSLAHTYIADVQASYVQRHLLERRRRHMAQWWRFVIGTEAPTVVRLRSAQ